MANKSLHTTIEDLLGQCTQLSSSIRGLMDTINSSTPIAEHFRETLEKLGNAAVNATRMSMMAI